MILSQPVGAEHELWNACKSVGVELIDAAEQLNKAFSEIDQSGFIHRISVTALGRLLLGKILPPQYEQIIYIDGDTQIVSSLRQLEELTVPAGKFFAAADYTVLASALKGESEPFYFNSGVLKFERNGWIGEKAFKYFAENPHGKTHDQRALNAVAGTDVIQISNKWNFPKHFLHLVDRSELAIVHYMAHPKPWHGVFYPWSKIESTVYKDTLTRFPALASLRTPLSPMRYLGYKYRSLKARFRAGPEKNSEREIISEFLATNDKPA
ncbi:MAG: hypothetical protein Hens2KO_16080 [Henriciella sp.]